MKNVLLVVHKFELDYPTTKPINLIKKENFKLFDFFANCEYFENDFNYDEELKLPRENGSNGGGGPQPPIETIEIFDPDKLAELKETKVGLDGMKVDRELFQQFKDTVVNDEEIRKAAENEDWDRAEVLTIEKYENKPNLFATLEKLKQAEQLDRRLSWKEVLQRAFGLIPRFKNQNELLEDECDKYISIYKPESEYVPYIKNFLKAYVTSGEFRNIIDMKKYQELNFYAGFTMEDYKHLNGYRETLPDYIKDRVDRITQNKTQDLTFLTKLAEQYGYIFKIAENNLVFYNVRQLKEANQSYLQYGKKIENLDNVILNLTNKQIYEIQNSEELSSFLFQLKKISEWQDYNHKNGNGIPYAILNTHYRKFIQNNIVKDNSMKQEANFAQEKIYQPLNQILYGPPGTGKTYNTVLKAMSIIDNTEYKDVSDEQYSTLKTRFDELKQAGQIEFVTFHQSYSYEEFVEGIKPYIPEWGTTDNTEVRYIGENGIFKRICKKAESPIIKSNDNNLELNDNPKIWKVSLMKTGENDIRKDCMENNRIRIGFDKYGETINDETIFDDGGSRVLSAFIDKMEIGDIVLSCYSEKTIDASNVDYRVQYSRYNIPLWEMCYFEHKLYLK